MNAERSKKRCSLFGRNSGNPSYSDKLKAEIQQYLECLEKKQNESLESVKPHSKIELSDDKKNFLTSLPSVEAYVDQMTRILDQYDALHKEKDEIRTILQKQLDLI